MAEYLSIFAAGLPGCRFWRVFFCPRWVFFNLSFVAIMSTLWSVVFCVRCDCSRDFFSFSLEHKSKKIRKKKFVGLLNRIFSLLQLYQSPSFGKKVRSGLAFVELRGCLSYHINSYYNTVQQHSLRTCLVMPLRQEPELSQLETLVPDWDCVPGQPRCSLCGLLIGHTQESSPAWTLAWQLVLWASYFVRRT